MNFILIALVLSVVQNSFCYKLRRDVGKVRYYCDKICRSCGGEGSLNVDTCVCNFQEETAESRECLDRNRNKFDFLGIKWEVGHESVRKRSVSASDYPDFGERRSFVQESEQNNPGRQIFRRSYGSVEEERPRFRWRLVENPEKFQDVISYPRLVLAEHSKKSLEPVLKGSNQFRASSDLTRFAADKFQSNPEQRHRNKAELQLILDEPVPYLKPRLYQRILGGSRIQGPARIQASPEEEDFDSDYDDESDCGDDIIARLENLRSGAYDSFSSQEEQYDFVNNVNDNMDEKSDWDTVSPKAYAQNSRSLSSRKVSK